MPITVKFYTVAEVSKLIGVSEGSVYRLIKKGDFHFTKNFNGKIHVAQPELLPFTCKKCKSKATGKFSVWPKHKIEEARRKLKKLKTYNRIIKSHKSRLYMDVLRLKACKCCGVPLRTIQRWQSKYNQQGLVGLIDNRGGSKAK